ncbi:MAG: methyltransferase domain-containing protein [Candidatus Scalindua sp.]
MSIYTNCEDVIVNKRTTCSVCDNNNLVEIMDMPEFPITGLFSSSKYDGPLLGIDQAFLWCTECGHGQLQNQVSPQILYDPQEYTYRTSSSNMARGSVKVFLDYLKTVASDRMFNCIMDIGCNDLFLLNEIKDFGKTRVGLDPIWASEKPENEDHNLIVIGGTVENTDLDKYLPCKPDLIICRHTLEHVFDPGLVLEKLIDCASEDALFLFEIPGADSLVAKGRFDMVFHEHLQYFSLSSFNTLIEKCGAGMIGFEEHYHFWGALMVAFKKGISKRDKIKFPYTGKCIKRNKDIFLSQMDNTRKILDGFKNTRIYGYGAALMLSVLAYYLKSDLSFITAIIDDDKEKDGIYYANLPLKVKHSSRINDLTESTVLLTAIEHVKPIMTKLLSSRPRHIICPLHVI